MNRQKKTLKKKTSATPEILEEIQKLEHEVRTTQADLTETQRNNEILGNTLNSMDALLSERDAQLSTQEEVQSTEIFLLEAESTLQKDRLDHQVNFHRNQTKVLELRAQRVKDLREENDRLSEAVKHLDEQISYERVDHALVLHDMNRSMLDLRRDMEAKLRRDLTQIDENFKRSAFVGLGEAEKHSMLEHGKIKDGLALLYLGKASLSTRLEEQKKETRRWMKTVKKQSRHTRRLRDELAYVTTLRNEIFKEKDRLTQEYEKLQVKRTDLLNRLVKNGGLSLENTSHNSSSSSKSSSIVARKSGLDLLRSNSQMKRSSSSLLEVSNSFSTRSSKSRNDLLDSSFVLGKGLQTILDDYIRLRRLERSFTLQIGLANRRQEALKHLIADIRPVNADEEAGIYLSKHFPIQPLLRDIPRRMEALKTLRKIANSSGDTALLMGRTKSPEQYELSEDYVASTPELDALKKLKGVTAKEASLRRCLGFDLMELASLEPDLVSIIRILLSKESVVISALQTVDNGSEDDDEHLQIGEVRREQSMFVFVSLSIIIVMLDMAISVLGGGIRQSTAAGRQLDDAEKVNEEQELLNDTQKKGSADLLETSDSENEEVGKEEMVVESLQSESQYAIQRNLRRKMKQLEFSQLEEQQMEDLWDDVFRVVPVNDTQTTNDGQKSSQGSKSGWLAAQANDIYGEKINPFAELVRQTFIDEATGKIARSKDKSCGPPLLIRAASSNIKSGSQYNEIDGGRDTLLSTRNLPFSEQSDKFSPSKDISSLASVSSGQPSILSFGPGNEMETLRQTRELDPLLSSSMKRLPRLPPKQTQRTHSSTTNLPRKLAIALSSPNLRSQNKSMKSTVSLPHLS